MEGPFGLLKCFSSLSTLIPESTERSVKYRREIRCRRKWRKAGESKMKHIFMFPSPWAVARQIKLNQDSQIQQLKERQEQGLRSVPCYFAHPRMPFLSAHLFSIGSECEPGWPGPLYPALCGGKRTGSAGGVTAPPNSHCWQSARNWK